MEYMAPTLLSEWKSPPTQAQSQLQVSIRVMHCLACAQHVDHIVVNIPASKRNYGVMALGAC
jgi:hypothetical protein